MLFETIRLMHTITIQRSFLPETITLNSWEQVERFFTDLLSRDISSVPALHQWLHDRSELETFLSEEAGWRYIRMSCDTANEELAAAFNFFVGEIQPKIAPLSHQLDLMLLGSPALPAIDCPPYSIMLRQIRKRTEIFREENIPIIAELQQQEQEYSAITGAMTIEHEGREMTLQQASNYLEGSDRDLRESVFRKVNERRLADKEKLDNLFNQLIAKRHQLALNAGFDNYRDYMFAYLGRFDYTPQDCFLFHASVENKIVPLLDNIDQLHAKELGLERLMPWDTAAVKSGEKPLKPFDGADDLMQKTIDCFSEIDTFLGECMLAMKAAGRLDLESRKGKAPGGYNYPLYETGLPFIFMNSTNTLRDMVTMVHEGGHAVQSILNKSLELVDFKNLPSEVAELASMSMELITMEHWHHFFKEESDLRRAKRKHLEDVLKGLTWISCIDAFQHWLYTHPTHTVQQRDEAWRSCYHRFSGKMPDWTGCEQYRDNLWQKQLHIFEVPFYYIEYGFAQLGAIAVWKNYRNAPEETIENYRKALSLGYTHSIGEVYETAGVRFDFSTSYVSELSDFVLQEWKKLVD
jgi:oligoendopeptidase F